MALDSSTIQLLLEIGGDSAKARAALDSLKGHTTAVTGAMAGNFSSLASTIESGFGNVLGPGGVRGWASIERGL